MTASRVAYGFIAGCIAVLLFHQGALLALHLAGIAPSPWNIAPVPPFGVPAVVSAAFWGGVWGSSSPFWHPASAGAAVTG